MNEDNTIIHFEGLKQVSKSFIQFQEFGFKYYIYNPLTDELKEQILDKNSIVFNKHCFEGLKFYIVKND
ncbi:MAG: hypothetical protein IKE63_00100 [Bacilli bacterium]|nr:hypothetical protein [Bacilli bacterium]